MRRFVGLILAAALMSALVSCADRQETARNTGGDIGKAVFSEHAILSEAGSGEIVVADDNIPMSSVPDNDDKLRQIAVDAFRLVNAERENHGLAAYKWDEKLYAAASVRAKEVTSVFDHKRPDGGSCFSIYGDCGINAGMAAENIASGQINAAEALRDWMNSPQHRESILGNYEYMAVGVVENQDPGKNGYSFAQLFYTPAP